MNMLELSLREAAYEDLSARAVYCDFLEEQGRVKELKFWKWILTEKFVADHLFNRAKFDIGGYFTSRNCITFARDKRNWCVPDELYQSMTGGGKYNHLNSYFKRYDSLRDLWKDLEQTYYKLL